MATRTRTAQAATLDVSQLDFNHALTGIERGHLQISALYPSRTEPGVYHTVQVKDDGTAIDCDCKGSRAHGKCFHRESGKAIVREYWRRDMADWHPEDIRREDDWLTALLRHGHDAAIRLKYDALADVIGAQFIAAHERVGKKVTA